ncbi:MAG TPA: hypothetical protein VFX05_14655 [Casimicrobiaceae bacterium]|jgi:hypothetical protein|nr:hypothetical protein [Casimicrobiaceae bacterium]
MEWIILESLVVLALALAIVWWTIAPGRRRRKERDREPPPQ